jgi:hypothetical protein
VRETLADRPAAGLGAPPELFSSQAVSDGFSVTEIGVDLSDEHRDVGSSGMFP